MSPDHPYPPLPDEAWPKQIQDMLAGFAGGLNVYRVMAYHPALLRAWAPLRHHVVVDNALGRELSEVTILRTGWRLQSDYEWGHHVSRARACGLDDARIASIRGAMEAMHSHDAVIAGAVDELLDQAKLSDVTQEKLVALVGTSGLFDVMATVGHYSVLAFIVNSFKTPLDPAIAAQLAVQPLDQEPQGLSF